MTIWIDVWTDVYIYIYIYTSPSLSTYIYIYNLYRLVDGSMDGWTGGHRYRCIYSYITRCIDGIDGWMDGSMGRWIDRSMGGWIDGSMDRLRFGTGLGACISSRITTVIHVRLTIKQTITVLLSHSQFRRITAFTETCMA